MPFDAPQDPTEDMPEVSQRLLCGRILRLAEEARRDGFRTEAERLVVLAYCVLDHCGTPRHTDSAPRAGA